MLKAIPEIECKQVWDKFYIASGDFLEEVRDFDFVKISLTLREVL